MSNQEARELRDEIAQEIAEHLDGQRFAEAGIDGQRIAEHLADEILPIVTQREAALRERLELAEENTAEGADEAVRQAQTMAFTAQRNLAAIEIERDQLIEKINALADSLDNETVATLWPPDDEMKRGYRHGVDVTRRDAARRLRGLVSGDATEKSTP